MIGGDLANGFTPRYLFLWEHLAANLPMKAVTHEHVLVKCHQWKRAVDQWDIAPMLSEQVWDLWRRYDMRCDMVVTTRPQPFADKVQELLDAEDIPIHTVYAMPTELVARKMGNRPDVARIVFGDPKMLMSFGHKGMYLGKGLRGFNPGL